MNEELFDALEKRIESLVDDYKALRETAFQLKEENERLIKEREVFKERLDTIIRKLEGV